MMGVVRLVLKAAAQGGQSEILRQYTDVIRFMLNSAQSDGGLRMGTCGMA